MSLGEPEDTADEMVRKIRALQETGQQEIAQMEEQEKQRLLEIAGKYEDCVYIEVSSVHSGSKLVYHLGDAVGIVNPGVHIGMFQDSVLYMKYATEEDPCALDFRYFPRGFGDVMETRFIFSLPVSRTTSFNLRNLLGSSVVGYTFTSPLTP